MMLRCFQHDKPCENQKNKYTLFKVYNILFMKLNMSIVIL